MSRTRGKTSSDIPRLFVLIVGLGALLLFLVQPLLGRLALPVFGGGARVWLICLLFFQTALLGGYLYAHLLVLRLPVRRGVQVHLALCAVSLIWLPIGVGAVEPHGEPVLGILGALALAIAGPYLVLSATSPLLHAWAARLAPEEEPYALYAWSNLGSLGALIAYPLLLEPWMGLQAQSWIWSGAYVLLAALVLLGGRLMLRAGETAPLEPAAGRVPSRGDRFAWLLLSAAGSAMLLACTDALTEDVSATPVLWVLPLGLYLLTFIIRFGRPQWSSPMLWVPLMLLGALTAWWAVHYGAGLSIFEQILGYDLALFLVCMALHGELVRRRPGPAHRTGFYLIMSAGGALGGLAVGVLAPLVLPLRLELHLLAMLCPALIFALLYIDRRKVEMRAEPAALWALPILFVVGMGFAMKHEVERDLEACVHVRRGFYGVLKIKKTRAQFASGPSLRLLHGRILHGRQFTDERGKGATSYYGPHSGIGLAFRRGAEGPPRRIGVVGLGIGTVAVFGRAGDTMTFFEIDPEVTDIARTWFTYLKDSKAKVEVVHGDARLTLARHEDQSDGLSRRRAQFDVLVLDAFSADAIPVHLLTREAFALYLERLAPNGVIALNISNRHLELRPVVRAHAEHFGLFMDAVFSGKDPEMGYTFARWSLLSRDQALGAWLKTTKAYKADPMLETYTWTDDFNSPWPLLRALR